MAEVQDFITVLSNKVLEFYGPKVYILYVGNIYLFTDKVKLLHKVASIIIDMNGEHEEPFSDFMNNNQYYKASEALDHYINRRDWINVYESVPNSDKRSTRLFLASLWSETD